MLTISDISYIDITDIRLITKSDRDKRYRESEKGRQTAIRKRYREARTRLTKRIQRRETEIANLERELHVDKED